MWEGESGERILFFLRRLTCHFFFFTFLSNTFSLFTLFAYKLSNSWTSFLRLSHSFLSLSLSLSLSRPVISFLLFITQSYKSFICLLNFIMEDAKGEALIVIAFFCSFFCIFLIFNFNFFLTFCVFFLLWWLEMIGMACAGALIYFHCLFMRLFFSYILNSTWSFVLGDLWIVLSIDWYLFRISLILLMVSYVEIESLSGFGFLS